MSVSMILPADEAAWHEARSRDITASIAAGLLGIHPYTSPYRIWAEKTGRMQREEAETKAMRRGRLLEPIAIQALREERPTWIIEYLNDRAYFRDAALRIGATPDAFAHREDYAGRGIVQVKTTSHEAFEKDWRDPDTGDVVPPLWIAVQTIVEAMLTGSSWASVAALIWNRDALDLHVIDVPVHAATWKRVVQKVAEFWALVDSGEEPDPDWGRDGRVILSVYAESEPDRVALHEVPGIDGLIDRYERAGEVRRAAERERELLKPQIIYALGNAEAGFTPRFSISAPTTRKDSHVVKSTTFRSLRVKPRSNVHG